MGIDDFMSGDASSSGSDSTSSSTDSTSSRKRDLSKDRYDWVTKINFSTPYIVIARDAQGNVYKHEDHLAVLDDRLDWRRLDDHPQKDMEVLYSVPNERRWLQFCSRAQDQLGVDPEDYLNERPEEIAELRERVHFPNPSPPDQTRDCRICGTNSSSSDVTILELDLQKHRRVPVCSSHSVEELAHNGLLE